MKDITHHRCYLRIAKVNDSATVIKFDSINAAKRYSRINFHGTNQLINLQQKRFNKLYNDRAIVTKKEE